MSADRPQILVAGGGVAGLEAVLALRALAGERVDITLLAPERHFLYRPLAVGEPFGAGRAVRYEVARLTADAGVRVVRDALEGVDADARRARTQDGALLPYDALVLALGARARDAVPGAIPFRGPRDVERIATALRAARDACGSRVAFVAPAGATWTLPLYELALLTGAWARREWLDVELTLVTPEPAPLGAFGPAASARVAELLEDRGVALRTESFADAVEDGRLWMALEESLPVDVAIALPALIGPGLAGLPVSADGFVPVDAQGRVAGLADVYAVGDMTDRGVKHGGLATQQADAAAAAIAAWAGAPVTPEPATRVLRGLLLTGGAPLWLRHDAAPVALDGDPDVVSADGPLWWPPHKIAGRHLAPWLAAHADLAEAPPVGVDATLAAT